MMGFWRKHRRLLDQLVRASRGARAQEEQLTDPIQQWCSQARQLLKYSARQCFCTTPKLFPPSERVPLQKLLQGTVRANVWLSGLQAADTPLGSQLAP